MAEDAGVRCRRHFRRDRGGDLTPAKAGRSHQRGRRRRHGPLRPRRDFVAFRSHITRPVEIKPTPPELLEGRCANAMTLFEDTRQEQAQLDPDSQECAGPEWVMAGFTYAAAGPPGRHEGPEGLSAGHGHRRKVTVRHLPGAASGGQCGAG